MEKFSGATLTSAQVCAPDPSFGQGARLLWRKRGTRRSQERPAINIWLRIVG